MGMSQPYLKAGCSGFQCRL